ncbi:N-acetylneuraminate synthase family protein [Psychromonas sp. MME2]|uniref:N-acetylneuraminate synthase family protein n=1 Tax=unclassified Psychromonas TaxID=2614957 RepID=UPI00339D1625
MASNTPMFIAEVSSNHGQNIDRAKEFIKVSKAIGCDAVKFQLFKVEQLFAPEILQKSAMHRDRKAWELPVTFIPELSKYTHELGMQFTCTPFYLEAVTELEPYVDFYKIASYELLWDELIIACAQTGKDLILSTGMATLNEIKHAVEIFRKNSSAKLTLLHAISGYPTPIIEANVKAIHTLKEAFDCPVGLSDHSVSPAVLLRAIHKWGASAIEFHLDLDGQGEEFSAGHCWLPDNIKQTITLVKDGIKADGDGVKKAAPSEEADRLWRADPSDGLRPFKEIRDGFESA